MPRAHVSILFAVVLAACGGSSGGNQDAAIPDGGPIDAPPMIDADPIIDAPVDVTPPDTVLASMPSAISGPDVTFMIGSTEPDSTFRCSVDSTTLAACDATAMFSSLSAGAHTFRAAAIDAAGNEDASPVEYTWTVDPNELDTMITMGPGPTSGPDPQFTFTSTRQGTFECMLAPSETQFAACTSPMAFSGLPELAGGYVFHVRARDTADNLDASPAMHSFEVDATGPAITITSPANDATVGTSVTLAFTSESGATYTCQLDDQPVITPCASGLELSNLTSATNPHTIRVTGTDAFDNTTTAMHTFTVDDVGPSVSIGGSPANGSTVNTTSANLTFEIVPSNEPTPYSFECRFDNEATYTACAGFVRSGLLQGTHTMRVRARDRFDNVGPDATHTWTITALNTTIFTIRTTGIAVGTRVSISTNVRLTGKTSNRFWVQEQSGTTSPPPSNRGITVLPVSPSAAPLLDAQLVPGRALTIIGTVGNVNGNLVLEQASYFTGSLLAPYSPKDTSRDSLILLSEANEGMLVDSAGRASTTAATSCTSFDFCIVTCDRLTPVVDSIDGTAGTVMIDQDHVFQGIVEGNGTGFTYFVTAASAQADACL